MKTLVLANHKGGVAKSAVATMLAQLAHARGLRVLAIDLDHQGNFGAPLITSRSAIEANFGADQVLSARGLELPAGDFVVVPGSKASMGLERQPDRHNAFAQTFRDFVVRVGDRFDLAIVDTNPNPDIRLIAALVSADAVLSPIQLNQEALGGVAALLDHERVGLRRIKAVLNPELRLIGLLPTLVEATPFQRANFEQIVQRYRSLTIPLSDQPGDIAWIPKRSAIAEAQVQGRPLWTLQKTAARDAWREIELSLRRILEIVIGRELAGDRGAKRAGVQANGGPESTVAASI